MCNSIFINDKTIPKAKDGEEFEVTVKGTYYTEDGVRKLDVSSVDGKDVVPPEDYESECSSCKEDKMRPYEQDSEDALRIFMIKTQKGK